MSEDQLLPEYKGGKQHFTTFEQLLDRRPSDLSIRKGFNEREGWTTYLETVSETVPKVAAFEKKHRARAPAIQILGFSTVSGKTIVRFEKEGRCYQGRLEYLQAICPKVLTDYLLTRFDPSTNRVKSIPELEVGLETQM